jgi:hypothetical protein
MRRLMAAQLSVAMLMSVVWTLEAQPSQTPQPSGGSSTVGSSATPGTSPAPAAPTTPAKPASGLTAAPSSTTPPAAATTAAPATTKGAPAATTATPTTKPAAAPSTAATIPPPAAATTPDTVPPPSADTGTTTSTTGVTQNTAVKDVPIDAGTYGVRLRDLEQRINELKEQIFRSKARLSLLAETVLQGVVAGSQARIVHQNKMGSSYKLVKVLYSLDGAPIFNKADEEGSLGDREEFDVYNGSIVPGEHTLTVKLEYRGNGYGIFSYLKGYRFKVNSSHTFTAPEGKAVTLRIVGYEKGGPTAPLEDRPAIQYIENVAAQNSSEPQASLTGAGGA